MDSGACDHVANPEMVAGLEIKETIASRSGVTYLAANGNTIHNLGEVDLCGTTSEGSGIAMTVQLADVTKPLASVRKMCGVGNRVVFDEEGSYIECKSTGARTPIRKSEGTYEVDVFVLVPADAKYEHGSNVRTNNQFSSLGEQETTKEVDSGFPRHAI